MLTFLLSAFLLSGCAARGPALDGAGATIEVVGVLESYEVAAPASFPAEVSAEILEVLVSRNLRTSPVEDLPAGAGRTTALRVEALGDDALTLLVEADARFYSQLSGRYRWVVHVTATLFGAGRSPETEEFDVPVFLQFDHEREPQALAEAAPVIGQQVGGLVDRAVVP